MDLARLGTMPREVWRFVSWRGNRVMHRTQRVAFRYEEWSGSEDFFVREKGGRQRRGGRGLFEKAQGLGDFD